MIGNAHLDPVWRWRWTSGLDEAITTAYSMVKRLQEYPEFLFTRSDSWFHEQIEKIHPELFSQIRHYVAAGRWQIVGGWYIQPDCNLPSEYSLLQQARIGNGYFQSRFGKTATVGYNVDSFGHAGSFPAILRRGGFDSYVFMRPQEHEKELPDRLFRWQAAQDESTVLAFRILDCYCCGREKTIRIEDNIKKLLEETDPAIGHTMCFYGVGDHGGGPTKKQIEYILENQDAFKGAKLIFSHPRAFFDAVVPLADRLPIVKGELQKHAIGCYSVEHRSKQALRQAEYSLQQTEDLANRYPDAIPADGKEMLQYAWKQVLFNQFHDILGGSSLRTAYKDVFDQIGAAAAAADEQKTILLRKQASTLARPDGQVIALVNSFDQPYQGWVEHTIWNLEEGASFQLIDQNNREIPFQQVRPEAPEYTDNRQILIPAQLAPAEWKFISVVPHKKPTPLETDLTAGQQKIQNSHWYITAQGQSITLQNQNHKIELEWLVRQDTSDTWSHGLDRFNEPVIGSFTQRNVYIDESGPLRTTLNWITFWDTSKLVVKVRLYRNEPWAEILITTIWNAKHALLKCQVKNSTPGFDSRVDGIPGSFQPRPLDATEFPFHDWTLLDIKDTNDKLALISPDIFSLDGDPHTLALTLLRSPVYTHDMGTKLNPDWEYDYTDQGRHDYRMLISLGEKITASDLARIARQLQQPPIAWDMPWQ